MSVNFDEVVEHIVRGVEACGIAVLIVGMANLAADGVEVEGQVRHLVDRGRRADAYVRLRTALARVILLGLEILLLADIILTIVVEATLESVAILAGIVVIRIVLSFSLEVEIDGVWPWNRWRIDPPDAT